MKLSLQHLASTASTLSFLLLNSVELASAHYQFPIFIHNGTRSEWWQYVRPTALDAFGYHFSPIWDWITEPQVCGRGATKSGHGVETAVIEAGSQIGFQAFFYKVEPGLEEVRPARKGYDFVSHEGPAQLYLSKAPGALEDYEGDGDWFKIGNIGISNGIRWDQYTASELNFTIPATTPPGKYLARLESLYINSRYNETQQFINCAQIEIKGPGGGKPGPMTKFPGAYELTDPGIWLPTDMTQEELKEFPFAGPPVWRG